MSAAVRVRKAAAGGLAKRRTPSRVVRAATNCAPGARRRPVGVQPPAPRPLHTRAAPGRHKQPFFKNPPSWFKPHPQQAQRAPDRHFCGKQAPPPIAAQWRRTGRVASCCTPAAPTSARYGRARAAAVAHRDRSGVRNWRATAAARPFAPAPHPLHRRRSWGAPPARSRRTRRSRHAGGALRVPRASRARTRHAHSSAGGPRAPSPRTRPHPCRPGGAPAPGEVPQPRGAPPPQGPGRERSGGAGNVGAGGKHCTGAATAANRNSQPHRALTLQGIRIAFVAGGPTAAHCIAGDVNGACYTWGRNEARGARARGAMARAHARCMRAGSGGRRAQRAAPTLTLPSPAPPPPPRRPAEGAARPRRPDAAQCAHQGRRPRGQVCHQGCVLCCVGAWAWV